MVKRFKKFIFNFYVVLLMVFTVWYGTFMYPLIFGFSGKEGAAESLRDIGRAGTEAEKMFIKLMADKGKTKTTDLGYKVLEQPYIEGRFHHIGFEIDQDKASRCIRCHGAVPHDRSKEVRSFLNMHAFYLACESCHMVPKKGDTAWEFRWNDKKTGEPTNNPKILVTIDVPTKKGEDGHAKYATYGDYGAKIAPGYMENDQFRFISGQKEMAFVLDYIQKQDMVGSGQRSQMKKMIHLKVSKKPLLCSACHNQKTPYLPLAELGYPPRRLQDLTSDSVVGMIEKYKKFWIPSFLTPGEKRKKEMENERR